MISFYRIEHPSGRHLYVNNDEFIKINGMNDHNYDDFHIGISDDIRDHHYAKPFGLSDSIGANDACVDIMNDYFDIIDTYLNDKTFRCFFNSIDTLKEWFIYPELKSIAKGGYVLHKYTFEVDFDPKKIFICDLQTAIDIEYLERESTIKETIEWDSISAKMKRGLKFARLIYH